MPSSPPGEIEVRPVDYASAEQRAAILRLLESYADTEAGGSVGMARDAGERLADDLASRPDAVALLAWSSSEGGAPEPVGLAIGFEGYSTFTARPLLNLHDLVVAPGRRGQGVGGTLLNALERLARERGYAFLTLEAYGANRRALRLYRRHGFSCGEDEPATSAALFFKKKL